jgi:hypothetical protein
MKRAALIAVVAACSGPSTPAPEPVSGNSGPPPPAASGAPSCDAVVDHVMTLFPALDENDRSEGVAECGAKWSDDLKRCAFDAQSERALIDCVAKHPPVDLSDEPAEATRSEAEVNLDAIKHGAKAYFLGNAQFPKGSVPLSPPRPCCELAGAKCPPEPAVWEQPVWDELTFSVDDAHYYRYSYQSDGATFVAIAEADLDCDGVTSAYVLEGRIDAGAPVFTLTKPARAE